MAKIKVSQSTIDQIKKMGMDKALKSADWYDESDAQTDYFNTAYYVDVNVGKGHNVIRAEFVAFYT
jgi:hypothetical protein